jgi:hypothetical protein
MQFVQFANLSRRQVMSDRDNEIAVATGIGVADRERPLQVGADEIAAQPFSDPVHQDR